MTVIPLEKKKSSSNPAIPKSVRKYSKIKNEIRRAIQNNDPIDNTLHVIIVINNPCNYSRRYELAQKFIDTMTWEENYTELYIVELVYKSQEFKITDSQNPRHLQIRTDSEPLWHKENLINLGVEKLLPSNWKALAWIDADVEFEDPWWALNTLKVLNGCRDIVQPFSQVLDLDYEENVINVFSSFGYQYAKNREYCKGGISQKLFHPGMAWACTRKTYEKFGGLYERSIIGSGDHIIALSLVQMGDLSLSQGVHPEYLNSVMDYQSRCKQLRLGYIPGVIRHYFHGSKKNRRYSERWKILVNHQYQPSFHVQRNDQGILVPTKECSTRMLEEIQEYFMLRNEDEKL